MEGVAVVGETLTATPTPSDATVTYQWQIADAEDGEYIDIDGATSSTYIPVVANAGKYIRVTITGTGNYRGTVISAPVGPAAVAILSKADPNPDVAGTVDWTRFAGKVEVADLVGAGEISAYYIFEITSGILADGTVLQYYHYETKSWQNFAYEDGKFRFGPKGGFDLAAVGHGPQTEFQGKIDGTGITGSAYLVEAVTGKIISNVVETTVSPPVINTTKNKGYNTIQAAIDDATAGDTIEVSAGTFDEALSIGKSLTILGVNAGNDARASAFLDAGSIVTGGIRITAGDVTIKGLTIKTKGILASNIAGLTLVNNRIAEIGQAMADSPAGSIIGLDVMTLATGPIVINQNRFSEIGEINGTGTAIRIVQAADSITITDNIIEDVTKNGINLYANCLANENAILTITGNEIINWDSDKDQVDPDGGEIGGRAIRIDFAGAHTTATADITGNKLTPPIYPEGQTPIDSEYVKLTAVGINVDLTKNYWGSASPAFGTILSVKGTKAADCAYVPYYTDEAMTTLAASIKPEVNFAFTGLVDVTAGTVSFTITTKVTNNGAIANDIPLRYKAVVTKDGEPLADQVIKYPEMTDVDWPNQYHTFTTDAEGTAYFGPSTGFTLTQLPELLSAGGVTTPFQAEFAAGEYSVTVSLLDISDEGEVELGSGTKGFSVGYVTTLSVEEPSTMVAGTVGWTRFAGTVDVAEGVEDIKAYYIFEIEGENGLAEETLPQYYHYSGDEGTEGTWLPFAEVDGEDNQYRFGPSGGFPLTTDLPARGQTEFQVNIAGDSITVKAYLVDADTEETISNVLETTITANPITE